MKVKTICCWMFIFAAFASGAVWADNLQKRAESSRKVVKQFAGQLKRHLKQAVHQGGPVNGIKVCAETAPEIALELAKKNHWRVARTSLKFRNSDNATDEWETVVLKKFEERKQAGEDVQGLEYYEVLEKDGKRVFRYMKAIPTKSACLACHGAEVSEDVSNILDAYYPEDNARGFKKGDIRGAFTISQPMEK